MMLLLDQFNWQDLKDWTCKIPENITFSRMSLLSLQVTVDECIFLLFSEGFRNAVIVDALLNLYLGRA